VRQTKSRNVTPALKKLVGDARASLFTAVVVAGEISWLTVDIFEQHEQCV
jgi:hypothetical protein